MDDGATRSGRLYKIDPATAAATLVGAGPFSTTLGDTDRYGFDFNPTFDVIRLVNSLDANIRLSPNDVTISVTDTNISNGVASDEIVVAVAYDRNFGSTKTTLYGYDFINDNLVTIGGLDSNPSPNGGVTVLVADSTLGGMPFSTNTGIFGFDIGGPFGGPDVGWLATSTSTSGGAHLYTIDLATAVMTDLGLIGAGGRGFGGLAVQIDAPDPAISTDGKTATWTDFDGDAVTLKITKGALTGENFRMLAGTGSATGLAKLTLTDAAFTGTNITITAKPGAGGGDGRANVGEINAFGVDLGAVTIAGDLIAIDAGTDAAPAQSLKSLTVASMGAFGRSLLSGGGNTESMLADGAGKISVAGDFFTSLTLGKKKTGSVFIGGNAVGGTSAGRGSVSNDSPGASLGQFIVKGSLIALDGDFNSRFILQALGSATIGGDIIGSAGSSTARLDIEGTGKTTITIGGSLVGGSGSASGRLTLGHVAQVKIGGSMLGGSGSSSGGISILSGALAVAVKGSIVGGDGSGSGSISATNSSVTLKSVVVGGSVVSTGGELRIAAQRIGVVKVGGDIAGYDGSRVVIAARGAPAPTTTAESIAIASITVGGDVRNALILAGVDENLFDITPDAAIGAIKIGRNLITSSISAGIDPINGIFGDGDDQFAIGNTTSNAAIIAKIASITIGGQLLGTNGGAPDSFGILAEQIGALTVANIKVPLTANKDDLTLGFTADVRVREL